jgi:hypothetical protein
VKLLGHLRTMDPLLSITLTSDYLIVPLAITV